MLFFYIRHGDPIYNPDSLTPLGKRQAEALAKRLAMHGIDKVYTSTSNRAILTAVPTCELLKIEPEQLDYTNEKYAFEELAATDENGKLKWIDQLPEFRDLFTTPEIRALGDKWYEHPQIKDYHFERSIERVYNENDKLFASLGYEHIRYTGNYKAVSPNDKRVALFAHGGFGRMFLSCLLDIPYPQIVMHFNMCTSGMTVINFADENGISRPDIFTYCSDSHLYKEGLPTKYNDKYYF